MQTRTGIEKQNGEIFSQEHLHLIYGYVYSYVRTHQEAEDLTEANVKVIQFRALKRAAELDGIATRRSREAIEEASILEAPQRLLKYTRIKLNRRKEVCR